jgi:hypothetical protein
MKKSLLIFSSLLITSIGYSQCVLTESDDTQKEITSCLNFCNCSEIEIPDGVTIDMVDTWDLSNENAITFTIQDSGSLQFSGNGSKKEELFLASGSSLFVENKNNSMALVQNGGGGQNRITIGSTGFKGNDFPAIIASGGANESGVLVAIGQNIIATDFAKLEVFPNPSSGDIIVELDQNEELNYEIISLDQSVLISGSINEEQTKIHLNLNNGMYLLRVYNASTSYLSKIVIE